MTTEKSKKPLTKMVCQIQRGPRNLHVQGMARDGGNKERLLRLADCEVIGGGGKQCNVK